MSKNRLNFINNLFYRLKFAYGMPVDLHKIDTHTLQTDTGSKTTVLEVIHIKNAVVLRARDFRSFVYDLAYISANKDFTTGGFFDPEDRRVLLDAKDLSSRPEIGDYFIIQNQRYDIAELYELEDNSGYDCLCRKIKGQNIVRIVSSHSGLILEQLNSETIYDKLDRTPSSELILTQEVREVP